MLYLIFFLFFFSCSANDSENRVSKPEVIAERILRSEEDLYDHLGDPILQEREPYIWEDTYTGIYPRITQEYFRCRGDGMNPVNLEEREDGEPLRYFDCNGKHSLFLHEGKEHIHSILLDLLNYVQEETGKRVVITSAYRCPQHNTYCDLSRDNRTSKHMIGAEVDFYVEGMEEQAKLVQKILMGYYQGRKPYAGDSSYTDFQEYHGKTNVSLTPLYNKEVFLKVMSVGEGRDVDNAFEHEYLSIQVRYDRELAQRVSYSWEKAFYGYYRW